MRTDFIITILITQNTANNRLIDIVLRLPYQFYCHTQNQLELSPSSGVSQWLANQITQNNIKCLSDLDLINSIQTSYACSAHNAIHLYLMFLEQACSIFSVAPSYFFVQMINKQEKLSFLLRIYLNV